MATEIKAAGVKTLIVIEHEEMLRVHQLGRSWLLHSELESSTSI